MSNAWWWAGLALAAAVAAVFGFALGRLRWRSITPAPDAPPAPPGPVLAALINGAVPLDLVPGGPGETLAEPLARCVPKSLGSEGLLCELLDSAAPERAGAGARVTCFFAPQRQQGGKVNAFETSIAQVDTVAEPPRMLLATPLELLALPRRRHPRKRVSDQRFVRVRLWLAEPVLSPVHFPDAAPDIWINAYDARHGEENAVTNISAGGLALAVRAGLVPSGLAVGSPVVLKCSLFQLREKQFKPYWYAGQVRGLSGPEGGLRRIAVGFTHVGAADGAAPQGVAWTRRPQNDNQGERQ